MIPWRDWRDISSIDEYNHSKDAERLMEIVGASLTARRPFSDNRRSGRLVFRRGSRSES